MKPIKDYFKNARVGDRVEDLVTGPGKILHIDKYDELPICVEFDRKFTCAEKYKMNGSITDRQRLFYEGIEIIPPPEPRRKKKVWVNLYKWERTNLFDVGGCVHASEDEANEQARKDDRVACVEIEVDENKWELEAVI